MAKLVSVGRKLAMVGRKLVTDAGGAPCCCEGGCDACAGRCDRRSDCAAECNAPPYPLVTSLMTEAQKDEVWAGLLCALCATTRVQISPFSVNNVVSGSSPTQKFTVSFSVGKQLCACRTGVSISNPADGFISSWGPENTNVGFAWYEQAASGSIISATACRFRQEANDDQRASISISLTDWRYPSRSFSITNPARVTVESGVYRFARRYGSPSKWVFGASLITLIRVYVTNPATSTAYLDFYNIGRMVFDRYVTDEYACVPRNENLLDGGPMCFSGLVSPIGLRTVGSTVQTWAQTDYPSEPWSCTGPFQTNGFVFKGRGLRTISEGGYWLEWPWNYNTPSPTDFGLSYYDYDPMVVTVSGIYGASCDDPPPGLLGFV